MIDGPQEPRSDLEIQREREIRKGEAMQEIASDDAAGERAELIAQTRVDAADVLCDQPSCDECGRPLGVHRVYVRCLGRNFYLPKNLCLECSTDLQMELKKKLLKQ